MLKLVHCAGYWLPAKVLSCKAECICVHFVGWSSKYDETIPLSSGRLAVCGTKAHLPARKAKRKVEIAKQSDAYPPVLRQKVQLDTFIGNLSDSDGEIAEESDEIDEKDGHTLSTPVGDIMIGDCLVLKQSNRETTGELCTVSSISRNAVEVKCSWTGRKQTINVKDLTTARVTTFTTPDQRSTRSDEADGASGLFLAREWSDLVPARQYLRSCQYARDAERLIAAINVHNPPKKGVTYGTSSCHTKSAVDYHMRRHLVCLTYLRTCPSAERAYKSITPPKAIKEALNNPERLGTLVGIGEITDTCDIIYYAMIYLWIRADDCGVLSSREHPVKMYAVSTGRNEPVYCAYAKQNLPQYTVLGEYMLQLHLPVCKCSPVRTSTAV